MKHTTALLLTAVLLTAFCPLLAGCTKDARPLLWYQDVLVSADVSDGTTAWHLRVIPDGFTAEIVSPPEAAGVTFRITSTSASVCADGVEIPVSDRMTAGAQRLIELFTLDGTRVSDVRPVEDKAGVRAQFSTQSGRTVTVVFGADGLPVSFETDTGAYTVETCEVQTDTPKT